MTGARVRQVRELLGWTQTELSRRSGVRQARLSEIESGFLAPAEVVQSIARATGFPEAWFEQPSPSEFPDGTIRYRKTSKASKRHDRCAVRRLELAAELVDQLSAGLTLPSVSLQFLGGTSDDVEKVAADTREVLGLAPQGPVKNVTRAIERAGAVVVGLPVDLAGAANEVRHHHGVSAWPSLDSRPVIGFSTADPGDRQRHTLAHEVGHLVLHRGDVADRDYESEASRFAGAFLMPRQDATDAFAGPVTLQRLGQLKAFWGISIAGLVVRATQVGVIDRERQTSLFKQLSARGWRKTEPVTVHREQPALISRLIAERFGPKADWRAVGRRTLLPPHLVRELALAGSPDLDAHAEPLLFERQRNVRSAP